MRKERENIMLCYPATERRIASFNSPFFWQPKLNGSRCRVEWFKGEPVLLSSYGIQFQGLSHIEEALKKLPKMQFDGELYKHGWERERIHSATSRKVKESEDSRGIEFHIFDFQKEDMTEQWERIELLASLQLTPPLFFVPTGLATTATWQQCCKDCVDSGYEGIILRDPKGFYEMKRSTKVAKFKPTFKDIYKITGVKEAVDKYGELKGMVGAFEVQASHTKQRFFVGAGKMLHSVRIAIWELHAESNCIVGKSLKVKHEAIKTTNGIPVCCVALEVV